MQVPNYYPRAAFQGVTVRAGSPGCPYAAVLMFLCVVVFFPVVRVVVHKVHANINGAKQNHSAAACGARRHSRMSSGALPHKLLLVAVLTKPLVLLELCLSLRKIAVVATAAGVIITLRHAKA